MSQSISKEFGTLRSFFWPIHSYEVQKVLPMLLIMFLICFNYSILRCIKDSVVITTVGAEAVPFIKVWAVLPIAILLTFIFTKLSNRYSQEKVFYIIIASFIFFYGIFAFVLYPANDVVHPHELAQELEKHLPRGFYGLIAMFRYWSFTLFYALAELWSSIVLGVLFWGFANEITKIHEAKRFYAVLTVGSNMAAFLAGIAANSFSVGSVYNPNIPFGHNAFEQTLMISMSIIIVSGIATILIFRWMNKNVLNLPEFEELHGSRRALKKKKKMSIRESFTYLSNSKYLVCIAILVVAYNLGINLVEVIWKNQLRELYPSQAAYYQFTNYLTMAFGLLSTVAAFFLPRMIGRFGWTATAMITPAIMMLTGFGFFGFMFFQDHLNFLTLTFLGTTPLALTVMFGSAQNCLSKASKYSVFDATKEIAFIPLDHEIKLKGKAAIDGVGGRFGKSGGSLIHQGLIIIFGGLASSAPFVAAILMVVIVLWMIAVKSLGKQFNELTSTDPLNPPEKKPADQPVLA